MKIQQLAYSFIVTIPKTKMQKKGWTKGTVVDWEEYPNGDLVLKEVLKQSPIAKTRGDL